MGEVEVEREQFDRKKKNEPPIVIASFCAFCVFLFALSFDAFTVQGSPWCLEASMAVGAGIRRRNRWGKRDEKRMSVFFVFYRRRNSGGGDAGRGKKNSDTHRKSFVFPKLVFTFFVFFSNKKESWPKRAVPARARAALRLAR